MENLPGRIRNIRVAVVLVNNGPFGNACVKGTETVISSLPPLPPFWIKRIAVKVEAGTVRGRLSRVLLQVGRIFENAKMLCVFAGKFLMDSFVWVEDEVQMKFAMDVVAVKIRKEEVRWG